MAKLALFWCLNCWLGTDFTHCSSAFLVDFEHVNVSFLNFHFFGNALHRKQTIFLVMLCTENKQTRGGFQTPHHLLCIFLRQCNVRKSLRMRKQLQLRWWRNRRPASVCYYLRSPWQNWKHWGGQRPRGLQHSHTGVFSLFFSARNMIYCFLCWETVVLW